MQSEPERLGDDEVYELDRKAWNLPRPRPRLGTAPVESSTSDDVVGHGAHSNREAEPAA
jgi:hypothetical protein